jgi:alpha-beta hydrolase superfamily lysophospholipase
MSHLLSFTEPDGLKARGTIVVLPGRGESPDVYRRFGMRLAFDAYRVHVVTDPTTDPDAARDQLAQVTEPDLASAPLVLLGSDTGALFAADLLAAGQVSGFDGLILAGLPVVQEATAADSWDEELDQRTTCPTHRQRISSEIVRPGALYESVPDGWLERAALESIRLPVLALHGEEDSISPVEVARARYASAPAVEIVEVAQARHDVLNNQTHRTVAATVVLWLERLREDDDLALIASHHQDGVGLA